SEAGAPRVAFPIFQNRSCTMLRTWLSKFLRRQPKPQKRGRQAVGRSRLAARPQLEPLEDRFLPANLHITGAFLCDNNGNVVTAAAPGSLPLVQVTFETDLHDIPTGSPYVLRETLDGAQVLDNPLTWGSGSSDLGSWVYRTPTWAVTPGSHTLV